MPDLDPNSSAAAPAQAPGGRTFRATFSLPADLATAINRVAKRLRISQSALLAELLQEPVAMMDSLFDGVQEQPSPDQVRHFRGRSASLIRTAVHDALAFAEKIDAPAGPR